MYVITYSLKDQLNSSDMFYRTLTEYTDEVLTEIETLVGTSVNSYIAYLSNNGVNQQCTRDEYGFELLILGTLWEIYSGDADGLEEVPKQLLSGLAKLRRQGGIMKPGIDFIRGILSTKFLSPDLYDHLYKLDTSMKHLDQLLDWLEATGEFTLEVLRLRGWERYLKTLASAESEDILATSLTLAAWFTDRSEEVLGCYTENVDRYLNELRPERYWREDVIFCGRRRAEYHLNMVGAEIMNRSFRERFLKAPQKALLIPSCMRLLPAGECKGKMEESGFRCAGCTEECSVFKLMRLGKEFGFHVIVMAHESSISSNLSESAYLNSDTGIVGVACVLNLISGGWLLDSMGIPAQCVFLDYCGCKNHWSREGIPTEINVEQLKRIMGVA